MYDTDAVSVKPQPSLRAEQASHTRRRILDAAARVFVQQGFAGARIEDIASEAGVAVPTVYKGFANKVNLLVGALNQVMVGDEGVSIDQQAWFAEQLDEPDPERQLQLVARNARRIYERAGGLLTVLRSAVPLDPGLEEAWNDITTQRLERGRRTARNLAGKARDRLLVSPEEAAVTLWALTEPELFASYTAAKRSAHQYETWLGNLLRRALLR